MRARMYFDEIRHRPVYNAIVQISERAAQDQCQALRSQPVCAHRRGAATVEMKTSTENANPISTIFAPGSASIGEHAESDAGIFRVDDVEQARNDSQRLRCRDMRS